MPCIRIFTRQAGASTRIKGRSCGNAPWSPAALLSDLKGVCRWSPWAWITEQCRPGLSAAELGSGDRKSQVRPRVHLLASDPFLARRPGGSSEPLRREQTRELVPLRENSDPVRSGPACTLEPLFTCRSLNHFLGGPISRSAC